MSDWYDVSGNPITGSGGSSQIMRDEFVRVQAAMAKLPILATKGGYFVLVNAGGTALEATATQAALTALLSGNALTEDLDFGAFQGTNAGDAVDPQDLTTLAQVNSLIVGGGSPGTIPITSLDVGTATTLQLIRINAAGTDVEGYTFNIDWLGPLTGTAELVPGDEFTYDVTGGSATKSFPTPLVQGNYYSVSVFDSVNPLSAVNTLTLGRNGHTLYNNCGVEIDAAGDGNLLLNVGNYVKMVAISTTELKIVEWS